MTAVDEKSVNPAEDIPKDCMQCKITGVVFLSGLSLYWNHMRMQTPKTAVSHRLFLGTTSLGIGTSLRMSHTFSLMKFFSGNFA
jgi:hypothetical protein